MLLVIDAGNTNTVFAVYDGDLQLGQWRLSTDEHRTADEYGVWLLALLTRQEINTDDIDAAIVASVVPQTLFDLKTLCRSYFNTELLVVGEEGVETGVKVKIDRPRDVGADRLVNAYAAWQEHQSALIVVDFGTATTFDVVNETGDYIGGVIAPGINLSLEALQKAAAKLPKVGIVHPEKAIGSDTVSAMQSGIYFGYTGLIEGIVARIRAEYGKPMKVIATGGLAALYTKATDVLEYLDPDITLNGLRDIYHKNKKP